VRHRHPLLVLLSISLSLNTFAAAVALPH
jgi:hypothetical protein